MPLHTGSAHSCPWKVLSAACVSKEEVPSSRPMMAGGLKGNFSEKCNHHTYIYCEHPDGLTLCAASGPQRCGSPTSCSSSQSTASTTFLWPGECLLAGSLELLLLVNPGWRLRLQPAHPCRQRRNPKVGVLKGRSWSSISCPFCSGGSCTSYLR